MDKIRQFLSLLWTRVVVAKQQLVDFLLTASTYYGNTQFAKIDLRLLLTYRWNNPFQIARQYLEEHGANDLYTYGETPLTTMHLIAERAGIGKEDTVLELGCGRGRSCFWLREWIGCKVVGVEQVPTFVKIANEMKEYFQVDGVDFVEGDYTKVDWGNPTVVYLYASNLSEEEIEVLAQRIRKLPKGTKVISVSYPIPGIMVMRRFQLPFTWGDADIFVQIV